MGNRVCGHENAFFSNHQGGRNWGIGAANGKVCLLSSPFGRFEGNVFHNNAGFGWYVNVAFTTAAPRRPTPALSTTGRRACRST